MKKLLLIPLALMLLAATYGPPFSVSDLSSLTNRPNPSAINPAAIVVNGTNSLDAAGGLFVYLPTATNAVDNDTYFASTSTGRWVRVDRQLKTIVNPLLLSGGSLSLANSAVTPGTYTNTILTVNSNGLVTFATNGTISASGSSSNWYAYIYSISTLVTNFALVGNDTLSTYGPLTWHVTGGTNIYADIASHTITDAMLDYVPTNTLKGSDMSTAAGAIASVGDIQIGANLQLSGGVLSAITFSGTNTWQIGVDGTVVNEPNLADGTYVTVSASGSNVTFSIPASGATAGTYTNATVTVNDRGFVTSISSGSSGGGGAGTNAFINGVLVQPLRITNSTSVLIYTNGSGDITFNVNDYDGFWSDLTNALVADANVSFVYTNNTIRISASAGGGSTNGTVVTVDGGADLTRANFADTTGIGVASSGTNVNISINDRDFGDLTTSSSGTVMTIDNNAITSNKVAAANITQDKLSASGTGTSTNFLAGDYTYKQVTTNMIPGLVGDIANLQRSLTFTNGVTNVNNVVSADLAAGSNISFSTNNGKITIASTASGSLSVNGSSVSTPNFTNSSTALWNVSGTNISLTITNVPGTTTSNVLQWVGSAYFVVTNNSTLGDFQTLVTNGIITAASCVDCQNDSPGIIEFSFPSRSTNYVWTFMPEGNVNGYVAYEAEGYRGTNSLRIKIHETAGSVFFTGGYWMRFDFWDKVAVGGSGSGGGGDVYAASNNVFTASNTIANLNVTNFLVRNERSYLPTSGAAFSSGQNAGAGTTIQFYPWLSAGLTSGTLSQNAFSGITADPYPKLTYVSSTSANSGGTTIQQSSSFLLKGDEQFELGFYIEKTNAVVGRFGFLDTFSATFPTDGCFFEMTNGVISGKAVSFGTASTSGTSFALPEDNTIRNRAVVSLNSNASTASYFLYTNGTLAWSDTISANIPTGAGRYTSSGVVMYHTGTGSGTNVVSIGWLGVDPAIYNR